MIFLILPIKIKVGVYKLHTEKIIQEYLNPKEKKDILKHK